MKTIACLAGVLACCLGSTAQAYKESTHEALSEQAAVRSILFQDPTLLSDLGLGPWTAADYVGDAPSLRPVQQIIGFGATFEDTPLLRSFNHFLDPQFQNFAGRGLNAFGLTGQPSPDWALEDRGEVANLGITQSHSYRHAQQHYLALLTSQSPTSRKAAASSMFQMLGMVIHHIQDMAQPQHTRNDTHPTPPSSLYESYTADNVNARIAAQQFNGYPIPAFSTARQFWHSVASQADSMPRYIGMAEFTAQNYVSLGSVFSMDANGTISNHPEFRLPNGVSADGIPKRLVRRSESVGLANGAVKNEVMEYVVGNVFDGSLGQSFPDRLLASRSILTGPRGPRPMALAMGPKVFDDHYDVLLPRAIAFSAGLINHFFRGRMNLRRNPSGSGWFIDNVGQQDLSGNFFVYYDDAANNRQWIPSASWRTAIAPGQSMPVTFTEPPAGTQRLIAVFEGQIGIEGDSTAPAGGFFATAGKVINYTAPPPPTASSCGVPISAGGGSGITERTLTIGSTAQTVTANFEAYNIPDQLELFANATKLAGTAGFVSGRHALTFTFNPSALGTTQLLARVTGNSNTGTAWNLCVDCNNSACGSSTALAQRNVRLQWTYTNTFDYACSVGNVLVDGHSIGVMGAAGALNTTLTVTTVGERHLLSLPNAQCICTRLLGCSSPSNASFSISYIDGAGQTRFTQVPLGQADGLQFDIR